MNTFGRALRLTTFGESHGPAIGGVLDGFPPNIEIDTEFIQKELNKRKPGTEKIYSHRKEPDKIEFISGIFQGKTTGTPIAFIIKNLDYKSEHYEKLKNLYRPSHGDYTYQQKYKIRDWRGSGRYSARETAVRVAAGALAKLALQKLNIKIYAYTSQIGNIKLNTPYTKLNLNQTYTNPVRCPDPQTAQKMINLIEQIKKQGDTIGGIITGVIQNLPPGLGEPIYDKFSARLAYAMFSINAVKGFEIGSGFNAAQMLGSQHNDIFYIENGKIKTKTNFSGGIQAGITNGMDVYFNVAFKPVSTIFKPQKTINQNLEEVEYIPTGRHDPCVVPRAVPVVEAMAALVSLDFLLIWKGYELFTK